MRRFFFFIFVSHKILAFIFLILNLSVGISDEPVFWININHIVPRNLGNILEDEEYWLKPFKTTNAGKYKSKMWYNDTAL